MKTLFILLAGSHVLDGKLYTKGSQVPSDKALDRIFPHRFKRVEDSAPAPDEDEEDTPPPAKEDDATKEPEVDFGKNVTKKSFPSAVDKDLFVFLSNEGEYTITSQTEPSVKLNKGTFKKKASVEAFIKNHQAS
jgi:hypothetical protein